MRAAVVVPVFRRTRITQSCINHWVKMESPHTIFPLFVGDSEDRSSLKIRKDRWLEQPNEPLSSKFQAGIFCARSMDVDCVIISGSDDFPEPRLVNSMLDMIGRGVACAGMRDIYIYELTENSCWHWPGYPEPKAHGVMRIYSKKILDSIGWMLYRKPADRALDAMADVLLHQSNIAMQLVRPGDIGSVMNVKNGAFCINSTKAIRQRHQLHKVPMDKGAAHDPEGASVYAGIALIAVVFALRYRQIDGRASPDCQYYLNMSVDRKVPAPYAHRPLVPFLSKWISKLFRVKPKWVMRIIVLLGSFAATVAVYLISMDLGATAIAATAATVAFLMADAGFGSWVMFPWLTDPPAFAFAAFACLVDPIPAAILLALAALTKEAAFIIGAAWAILMGAPLWVAAPGIIAYILVRLFVKTAPPDQEWLEHPVAYAQSAKRRFWFDWKKNLAGMKSTPWLAAYLVPTSALALPIGGVLLLSWLQNHTAVDQARLNAAAMIFLAPVVASVCPDAIAGVWALSSAFWPFETEWA